MKSSVIVIIVLSCAFMSLLIGIFIYCYRHTVRKMCGRAFHRKKRVHEITAPVRPSGENEIVLAVTQRREHPPSAPSILRSNVSINHGGTTLARHNTVVGDGTYYQRHIQRHHPPYLVSRHQSFNLYNTGSGGGYVGGRRGWLSNGGGSDLPSPFVSNLSSLQSLLMSSQVAVFDSSTERLSLSSLNNVNNSNNNTNQSLQQPIIRPLRQFQLRQSINSRIGGVKSSSPVTVPPPSNSVSVHDRQPSYFDERPPSYQESILIQKLRSSDRVIGHNRRAPGNVNRVDLSRRSFRM